ncbi:MAG: triple tyrosine motif-containing protein, partial [Bacteroidota bacterium]
EQRAVYEAPDGSLWFGSIEKLRNVEGHQGGFLELNYQDLSDLQWTYHDLHTTVPGGFASSPQGKLMVFGPNTNWMEDAEKGWIPLTRYFSRPRMALAGNQGELWVASASQGLYRWQGSKVTRFSTQDFLLSNSISYLQHIQDKLWIATEKDISCFDGTHGVNEVLHSRLVPQAGGGSLKQDDQNRLWINQVSPDWMDRVFRRVPPPPEGDFFCVRYQPDTFPPHVLRADYKPMVDTEGNVVINWEGQDYYHATPADEILFSYRLNQGDWSPFTPQRSKTFFSLEGGDYRFEVRAMDKDFNLSPTPLRITFTVLPPVWQRTWFILLCLLLLGVIIYLLSRLIARNKRLFQLNQQLA